MNKEIGEEDCYINLSQDIAEIVFGTVIVRGLKQVFDLDQYDQCGYDGEFKNNSKCLEANSKYTNGTSIITNACLKTDQQKFFYNPKDNTIRSMINSNKCFDTRTTDSIKDGQSIQLWDCNNKDSQKFTYEDKPDKAFYYNKDTTKCLEIVGGALKINTCNHRTSQQFDVKRDKLTDQGYYCNYSAPSRLADCPPDYTNMGVSCQKWSKSKTSNAGDGIFVVASCPKGATNTGVTCHNTFVRDAYSKLGATYHTDIDNCEKKWGKGNCQTEGIKNIMSVTYPKCKVEATKKGLGMPEEYYSGGVFCAMDSKISRTATCPSDYPKLHGALCYVDCQLKYGSDYYNNGTNCWSDPDTIGLSNATCDTTKEFKNSIVPSRCYKKCLPGFTQTGEICSKAKTHVIKYSTKSN